MVDRTRDAMLPNRRVIGFVMAFAAVLAPGGARAAASNAALAAELSALAVRTALPADDLSPAFRLDVVEFLPAALRERPPGAVLEVVGADPAVRVHYAPGGRDTNLDGVPDRAEEALRVALRTLRECRSMGLGAPADDGDREIDVYVLGLAGATRGYAVQERAAFVRRGASGFAVVDGSTAQPDADFSETVARVVARLVFAARDAYAPSFWLEPSVLFVAERVGGLSQEMDGAVSARWNHPERGPFVTDPLLARGNVDLLWSLRDPELAGAVLAATWEALATRGEDVTAAAAITGALRARTGLTLNELMVRATVVQIVEGTGPGRWAARVQGLPLLDAQAQLPLAPFGIALVRVVPDPRAPEGTRVTVRPGEAGWSATLLARRRAGGWDQVDVSADPAGALGITLPWADYDQAAIIVSRQDAGGDGTFRIVATSADRIGLYALSAFGARALPSDVAEITWATAWEEGLFGWLVERAPSSDGPWEPVLATPVPAIGDGHAGSGYVVHDRLPAGRARLFYRVVVLTAEGLRVTGPAVAVRTPR